MREKLIPLRTCRYNLDQALVPKNLRLPDGRRVPVFSLVNRATKSVYININNKAQTDSLPTSVPNQKRHKYTMEERRWIATTEPKLVMDRYPYIRLHYIKNFIKQSQAIVNSLEQKHTQD